jgi:hypothetical protein
MTNYKENKNRTVFNIDFDGVLTTGEYTDDPGPDHSLIKAVKNHYMNGHIIIIWTARQWDQAPFLVSWLTKYSVPYHGVVMAKGGSDFYLDDKMITMERFYHGEF